MRELTLCVCVGCGKPAGGIARQQAWRMCHADSHPQRQRARVADYERCVGCGKDDFRDYRSDDPDGVIALVIYEGTPT